MNILGFVFSLMLILSYAFYACWDKQTSSNRLRKTYVSHEKAHRKFLNSYQSEVYADIKKTRGPVCDPENLEIEDTETEEVIAKSSPPPPPEPDLNPECSKLNIWPLIQEGREAHSQLYEVAAKMIRAFYPELGGEKRFEYKFLNDLIASAKKTVQNEKAFSLEKIALSAHQRAYYKMLKGTKKWNLPKQEGSPPLLDYIKADPNPGKICLCHAHPDVFTFLFNADVAASIYPEIHRKEGPPLTDKLLEKFCSENHILHLDPDLLALLDFSHRENKVDKKTLVAHDQQLSLRKTIYLTHTR